MLQIRLLGQFDVRADGKRVIIPSRTAQSLFAYLALTAGVTHRREKLAGMFWPDIPDENARKNLRQELWRIRKAISAQQSLNQYYLLADDLTLGFDPETDFWLDAAQLERSRADFQSLSQALSVYQGELLPGFYDDWVMLERERLQAAFDTGMEALIAQLIPAERWTAVQEQSERWLSLGTAPEPAFRALMLSHSARGDMPSVTSAYQRCVDTLKEQFGVEPSVETSALYKGLLKGSAMPRRSPSETVTFLFTDIEGSTRLLNSADGHYAGVLAAHHEILRAAVHNWNGREMEAHGDAFFATFARALDAVHCAVEAQRRLTGYTWPSSGEVRVRMGLYTGEPLIASAGYVGMDMHRAARIGDAGHGGQVLLSQSTRDLVMNELPPDISLHDLGAPNLKDMKYPAPIYQLDIAGLQQDFPPLRTKLTGTEPAAPGLVPFKGLQFFEETDAALFFGREALAERLAERLRGKRKDHVLVIVGASGSGKSSLVRAGLVPLFKEAVSPGESSKPDSDGAEWSVHILTPTAQPLIALAAELTRGSDSIQPTAVLMDDLSREPRSLALFFARTNPKQNVLLIIDQFEELFTLCRDEFEREAFIDNLLTTVSPSTSAAEGTGQVMLVLTLRADFYAHLAQYPELCDLASEHQEYIGRMTVEEMRSAIEEPARLGRWEFESGLVDLILRDVGEEPGTLPLLSHALLETWKRRAGHMLTLKGYADAGGVRGAIAHTAETTYQGLSPREQGIAREIFLRLTELGDGTEDTRRRASYDEMMTHAANSAEVRRVLNTLADARLLTLGESTAEVAHEALIREWPTLREWLNEDREGLRLHRRLTEAAHEWELLGFDAGALYRGAQLTHAREWGSQHLKSFNESEGAFLKASIDWERREEVEREEQRQRELEASQKIAEAERARAGEQTRSANRLRIRNRVISFIGVIALILAAAAIFFSLQSGRNASLAGYAEATAVSERDRADQQRSAAVNAESTAESARQQTEDEKRLAISRELAIAAIDNLEVDPERSVLLALKALSQSRTKEAEEALHQSVESLRLIRTMTGHKEGLGSIDFSPDGKRLVTSSWDDTAKIWDVATGQELLTLTGSNEDLEDVTFSPDGRLVAAGGDDHMARIWDSASGKILLTLRGHQDWIISLAFSPDGKQIVTASFDKTAKIWDTTTGQELLTFSGHTDSLNHIAYSPDGKRVATAGEDGLLLVWDSTTGKELLRVADDKFLVCVDYSPDGKRLAIGYGDGTVKVRDAFTGDLLLAWSAHGGVVNDIAFSPNGNTIATSGADRLARLWDSNTGQSLLTLAGHAKGVFGLSFNPDGTLLATSSDDKTAKLWDITPSGSREMLTIGGGQFRSVNLSPNEKQLVTSTFEGLVQVWDADSGQERFRIQGHEGMVYEAVYSPDGTRIATSGADNTARVWDAFTGKELLTLTAHGGGKIGNHFPGLLDVAFSPDGKRLATAGADGMARIWDAATGKEVLSLASSTAGLTRIIFSPDGKLLVASNQDSPDAERSATVWDAFSGDQLQVLRVGTPLIMWGIDFSPDTKRLVTTGQFGTVKIWDPATGKELMDLTGHSGTVFAAAFSIDGKLLATSSSVQIKVWDTATGKELLNIPVASGWDITFNHDGSKLIALTTNTVRIYTIDLDQLMELARQRVTRNLTTEECQRFLHVDQCPPAQ